MAYRLLVLKPVLLVDITLIHSLLAPVCIRRQIAEWIRPNNWINQNINRFLFFAAIKALWPSRFSLNEISSPSSGCDSYFTLPSIASSPCQVISGTNVHNSSKYTTMIHAQLFQCPFNNSKSISCEWYCQCSSEYLQPHLYNVSGKICTLYKSRVRQTSALKALGTK